MDRETVRRRNAHAIEELHRRGVIPRPQLPPIMRLAMRWFPMLRVPHYGDRPQWALIFSVLFGLPFGAIFAAILSLDPRPPYWAAWLVGVGGGAGFGIVFAWFLAGLHRRMQLTPWENLDTPASEAPEGAEEFATVKEDFVRRMSRFQHRTRR